MPTSNDTCSALNCDEALTGSQRNYCSNRCKQTVKYAVKVGRQCVACKKSIAKPQAVMGGWKKVCDRKRCVAKRCQ